MKAQVKLVMCDCLGKDTHATLIITVRGHRVQLKDKVRTLNKLEGVLGRLLASGLIGVRQKRSTMAFAKAVGIPKWAVNNHCLRRPQHDHAELPLEQMLGIARSVDFAIN